MRTEDVVRIIAFLKEARSRRDWVEAGRLQDELDDAGIRLHLGPWHTRPMTPHP